LEIGGNDGTLYDPLQQMAKSRGWAGVIIEPVPTYFKRLQSIFGQYSNVRCLQMAVGPNGEATIYIVNDALINRLSTAGKPHWLQGIASFDLQHLLKHGVKEGEYQSIKVPIKSATNIIIEFGIENVDVIQIDVEGYEQEVISTIDLMIVRPQFIIFESKHLQLSSRQKIEDKFVNSGYTTMWMGPEDSIAVRQDSFLYTKIVEGALALNNKANNSEA
jgi:FkbM family methyltransferase